MNAFTRMSNKGQVVVPKDVRDRKGWPAGTDLEVIEAGDGVLLRPRREVADRLTLKEAATRFRAIYRHEGPAVPVEELGWSSAVDDPNG